MRGLAYTMEMPYIEDSEDPGEPIMDPDREPDADDIDPDSLHWAAHPDAKIVAESAADRVKEYYDVLDSGGFLALYRLAHHSFFGLDSSQSHTSSQIIAFGEDGEKLGVRSNQLRSLVKYTYMSATQSQPAIKPRALNSDPESLAQVPIARRVLEYYDRKAGVNQALRGVALRCLLYAKAYLWQSWDTAAGKMGEDGRPTGDLTVKACSPMDMAADLNAESGKSDWYCGRVLRNKHDLVAMHATVQSQEMDVQASATNLKAEILDAGKDFLEPSVTAKLQFWDRNPRTRDYDDGVYEYHLMHRRTPAVPDGRYMIFLSPEVVLFDGPLPYEDVPVDAMRPEEFLEAGDVGYSTVWDLLGLQDLYDAALSICATNMDAFGHNDILIPEGVEIGYEELRDGLNIIRYPLGEMNRPEMLKKFNLDEGFFKFKDWIKGDMELAGGVNSVARGEPEKSLESGAALALVQAQAIQAQSPFVTAYTELVAESATTRLGILRKHMDPERVLRISGSDDPDGVRDFTIQDIQYIDRVDVESVNPLFKTIAGKQNAADKLLERGLIQSASEYLLFMESGRLENVTEDQSRKALFGRRVREKLMTGPAVEQKPNPITQQLEPFVPECRYIITDDPRICLSAASSVMDSFENRMNPQIQEACTAYMQDVLRTWRQTDPSTLTLLGFPVPQSALPPGGPPEGGMGDGGGGAPKAKPVDQAPPAEGSSMPSLPKPAESPL